MKFETSLCFEESAEKRSRKYIQGVAKRGYNTELIRGNAVLQIINLDGEPTRWN